MKKAFVLIVLASCLIPVYCQTKVTKRVGGRCEGCELYTEGIPSKLEWQTTIAQNEVGQRLQISGTIFKRDGKTPAPNVIMYIYHTDNEGLYKASPQQKVARKHGRLRAWIKTDSNGHYQFTTTRPVNYPGTDFLAHIHPTIKEPNLNEYYIDDFVFEDDRFMNDKNTKNMENRGGNGIVKLVKRTLGKTPNEEVVWIGKRDIILGLNIPNY